MHILGWAGKTYFGNSSINYSCIHVFSQIWIFYSFKIPQIVVLHPFAPFCKNYPDPPMAKTT